MHSTSGRSRTFSISFAASESRATRDESTGLETFRLERAYNVHPPVAAGGCTGAPWASEGDVQRSLVLAVAALGSCTRPAPTFCVGTAAAWSTRASTRTRKAGPLSEPTDCERAWETTATSSTRCRSDHPACTTEPISGSAKSLIQRRTWPSWPCEHTINKLTHPSPLLITAIDTGHAPERLAGPAPDGAGWSL